MFLSAVLSFSLRSFPVLSLYWEPNFPQRGSQLFWLPGLAETDVAEETTPAGLSPVGFVSGVRVAPE